MGLPEAEWCISTVRGLTFEACEKLLDRAAAVGLLTKLVENHYSTHPVLPWYFKGLFDQYYLTVSSSNLGLPACAFVEAIAVLGNYCNNQYDEGNRDVIASLRCEEANLLYAQQLAQTNGQWRALLKVVQGLRTLYEYMGHRIAWRRLVAEIKPIFVDRATNGSFPELDEEWSIVTEYCVQLAREEQRWAEAEELNRARVEWAQYRASSILALAPQKLDALEYQAVRSLAVMLHERGQICREQGKPNCIEAYEEAFRLLEQIGDQASAAVYALNTGHAYSQVPTIRDLSKAEQWYKHSLQLRPQSDFLGRSKCLTELGRIAHEYFHEGRSFGHSETQLSHHLNQSIQFFDQALNLLPQNAITALAVAHNQLGNVCRSAGDFDRAFLNYREAICYQEAQGDLYGAADTRFNVALIRTQAGRFDEALLYAQAAISNYEAFGGRAMRDIQEVQKIINLIEDLQKN
ncbi:MAG: tetratricopeptide repeat protein [Leptolyngbyaceae cyanobacterium SM1_4_3]|nr:tetratricopeptide repeat protein [Leptolyngbyaceae cyanobacterium SM1_4_3]